MSITKEDLAARLNGREYGEEMTDSEVKDAKNNGLVVIFGASDDLVELQGAIDEELGAYEGTELFISKDGHLLPGIEDDDEDILKKHHLLDAALAARAGAVKVLAGWCSEPGYSWFIRTAAPHSPFDIMEGSDKFCRGIVIDLKELG